METVEPDVETMVIKLDAYPLAEILADGDDRIIAHAVRRRFVETAQRLGGDSVAAFDNYV